jgi:hypothetical protein
LLLFVQQHDDGAHVHLNLLGEIYDRVQRSIQWSVGRDEL